MYNVTGYMLSLTTLQLGCSIEEGDGLFNISAHFYSYRLI